MSDTAWRADRQAFRALHEGGLRFRVLALDYDARLPEGAPSTPT